ncbi:MAG: shikimate dehydrogenase family protein [Candidatus Dadabacteria bacterium]
MKKYGLIGRTLSHSFSKNFFDKKFASERIKNCSYENFELKQIEEFPKLLKTNVELKGVNVTIPYKEEIIQYLTYKNEIVEEIGACNCIKITGDNLTGYNTDAIAFRKSLEKQLKPNHKRALIFGSGGASKAIQYSLKSLNIEYFVVSRRKQEGGLGYEDLGDQVLATHHLLINTTPLGMYPNVNQDPPVPYIYLTKQHFVFDLIYNPEKTKFMREAEKRGAQVSNGYEMLVLQAEESWRIWNQEL